MDGTMRAICHPVKDQQVSYNSWKCFHAVKFQGVMMPDGIIWQPIWQLLA
jgi:hypothetical protein